jgi:hypothetical protein
MVIRTKRHSPQHDSGRAVEEAGPEPVRIRTTTEIVTRRMSVGRMSTRSDIMVEKSPNIRRQSLITANTKDVIKDPPAVRNGRHSSSPERERLITVEVSGVKSTKGTTTGEITPIRSLNGSVSGSVTPKNRRINTRSKGNCRF